MYVDAAPVAAVTGELTPVEAGQVELMWRIASRVSWTRAGNRRDARVDFDVMITPARRSPLIS